jgi:hypothetical protein
VYVDPELLAGSISQGIVRALGDSYTMAAFEARELDIARAASSISPARRA